MRVLLLDHDYPPFLADFYAEVGVREAPYDVQLGARRDMFFGDAASQAAALSRHGHDARPVFINARPMQEAWTREREVPLPPRSSRTFRLRRGVVPWLGRVDDPTWISVAVRAHVQEHRPDVILVQCMHELPPGLPAELSRTAFLVGVVASPLPEDHDLTPYHLLLSSLPNFVARFRAAGADAELLPLAFDPAVRALVPEQPRDVEVSFLGSISRSHRRRREVLAHVAERRQLSLWSEHAGELGGAITRHPAAWGRDMYSTLARSLVTLNVHIDVAEGHANNLRLFEATGMGALLLTEEAPNLDDYFLPGQEVLTYRSPDHLAEVLDEVLADRGRLTSIAAAGQRRTLSDHTWDDRSRRMLGMLAARGVH